MKRQTRRNRYEKHRPIQLPKERPVQPTNEPTSINGWFKEWYENHRTQEQLAEVSNWFSRFASETSPEQLSQLGLDCFDIKSSSPLTDTNHEEQFYWHNAFILSLYDKDWDSLFDWFHQWMNDYHPDLSLQTMPVWERE